MLKNLLIGAVIVIAGGFVAWCAFIYLSTMLNMIRKELVEYCLRHRLKASPWALLLWEGIWGVEWATGLYSGTLIRNGLLVSMLSHEIFTWAVMSLTVLPLLALFFKARLRLFPLLVIKLLCVPLDIVYVISRGYDDIDFFPTLYARPVITRSASTSESNHEVPHERRTHRGHSVANARTSPRSSPGRTMPAPHRSGSIPASSRNSNSRESTSVFSLFSTDAPNTQGIPTHLEKYADQHRTRQEGDSYSTIKVGGETLHYTGDYVPFTESSEPVEVRHYDSDYAPFE